MPREHLTKHLHGGLTVFNLFERKLLQDLTQSVQSVKFSSTTGLLLLVGAIWLAVLLTLAKISQLRSFITKTTPLVSRLRAEATKTRHETTKALLELVETDGAGSWPPKATHYHSWPAVLRPYHEIYFEFASLLPQATPSLDDNVNKERIQRYRSLVQGALKDKIDITQVVILLEIVAGGNNQQLPRDAYNGLYACISGSRHAYRWATVPVVKVAQSEKLVVFPPELDIPWKFFQQRFGVTSPGGNVVSNFLCNFDSDGRIQYQINTGMTDMIRTAEYHFGHMFIELETLALPIYLDMNQSIIDFQSGDYESCLRLLKGINSQLRMPLRVFYERMHETKIPRSVWMSYVQGYQGWAAGEIIDGEYVEFDGLSGNQSLFFRVIDAFLGMGSYLTDENVRRYISIAQRNMCLAYESHSFREKAQELGFVEIEAEMQNLVKQFKVFRTAHITRVLPYLKVPAPERFAMTAGKSVLEGAVATGGVNIGALNDMLTKRLEETV